MALFTFAVAIAIELSVGEPPNALHPVAWMGHAIALLRDLSLRGGRLFQLLAGLAIALGLPAICAWGAACLLEFGPSWLHVVLGGALLSTAFSVRALGRAAVALGRFLPHDIAAARLQLRSLCSRDSSTLNQEELVGAAVESLAENTSDSVIAPLFWFLVFGVPGAIFYRAVNTLDAMIGYHGRYEYLGKASARLDDCLNWLPARLTALLFIALSLRPDESLKHAARVCLRDHAKTESPNAGWPMAALAGSLRLQLSKPGAYVLGDPGGHLCSVSIDRAWRLARRVSIVAFIIALIYLWVVAYAA